MGLLADPWSMEGAGGLVAPSEEPVVLEPVVLEPGACLSRVALICAALPAGGQYHGDPGSPLGRDASRGGGATYPGIPPMEAPGVVTPLEEDVTPYPGVCSTIWLHDIGEAT